MPPCEPSTGLEGVAPARRRLSLVGKSTLISEIDSNRSVASGVITLQKKISLETFLRIYSVNVLATTPRFRAKIVALNGSFLDDFHDNDDLYFEESPDFDINDHIHELEFSGNHSAFSSLITSLGNQTLDYSKPLWQMYLIQHTDELGQLKSRLYFRFHHCIGDGTSLLSCVLKMRDATDEAHFDTKPLKAESPQSGNDAEGKKITAKHIFRVASKYFLLFLSFLLWLCVSLFGTLLVTGKVIHLACSPIRPSPLKPEKLSGIKISGWFSDMDLKFLKAIAKKHQATLNDLMMASIAGALRNLVINNLYTSEEAQLSPEEIEHLTSKPIRVSIPVNLKSGPKAFDQPNNLFGFLICYLPIHLSDSHQRIVYVKNTMNSAKSTPERYMSLYCVRAVMSLIIPCSLKKKILNFFTSRVTGVCTNIRGPSHPMSINGIHFENIMCTVPPPPSVALGFAIHSYCGQAGVSVAVDTATCIDPQTVLQYIKEELTAMGSELKTN